MSNFADLERLSEEVKCRGMFQSPQRWLQDEIAESDSEFELVCEAQVSRRISRVEDDTFVNMVLQTIIAVLLERSDGPRCRQCGEMEWMHDDGVCYDCRDSFDKWLR